MSLLSLMMTLLLQSTGFSGAAGAFEQRHDPPAPARVAPAPKTDRQCGKTRPMRTCAGAIGFCPEYRCVEGEWVNVRRSKKPGRPGDPLSY